MLLLYLCFNSVGLEFYPLVDDGGLTDVGSNVTVPTSFNLSFLPWEIILRLTVSLHRLRELRLSEHLSICQQLLSVLDLTRIWSGAPQRLW